MSENWWQLLKFEIEALPAALRAWHCRSIPWQLRSGHTGAAKIAEEQWFVGNQVYKMCSGSHQQFGSGPYWEGNQTFSKQPANCQHCRDLQILAFLAFIKDVLLIITVISASAQCAKSYLVFCSSFCDCFCSFFFFSSVKCGIPEKITKNIKQVLEVLYQRIIWYCNPYGLIWLTT